MISTLPHNTDCYSFTHLIYQASRTGKLGAEWDITQVATCNKWINVRLGSRYRNRSAGDSIKQQSNKKTPELCSLGCMGWCWLKTSTVHVRKKVPFWPGNVERSGAHDLQKLTYQSLRYLELQDESTITSRHIMWCRPSRAFSIGHAFDCWTVTTIWKLQRQPIQKQT